MRRAVLATGLLLATVLGVHADTTLDTYHDLIRPHGQPRSDAIFSASLAFCYRQTGASRYGGDTPAFKRCMLGRGYRWPVRAVRSPQEEEDGGRDLTHHPVPIPDTPLPFIQQYDATTGQPIPQ
jgi:hypothetical protein